VTLGAEQDQSPGRDGVSSLSPLGQGTRARLQTGENTPAPISENPAKDDSGGRQSKRILWVIPNYRAVSANTQLPPLSLKHKFWLATQDSFDYSSFVLAGALAGNGQARNSTPQFRQGPPVMVVTIGTRSPIRPSGTTLPRPSCLRLRAKTRATTLLAMEDSSDGPDMR
jgi:hypothetical protein